MWTGKTARVPCVGTARRNSSGRQLPPVVYVCKRGRGVLRFALASVVSYRPLARSSAPGNPPISVTIKIPIHSPKHSYRGAARRAKSAGPIVAPTGRSVIISPEATTAGRTPPRVEIFSVDARPFCRADKSADFFAAPAPRAVSLGTRAGREADRSPLTRFSRACPGRRVLVDFWPEARDSPN